MRVTRWTIAVLAGLWACLAAPPSSAAAAPSTYRFLEEDAEGAFDLSAAVRATGEGEARLCFGYRSPKDHYYLRVRPRELALVRVENGKARELAPPSKLSAPLGRTPTELVLKRRAEKLSLLCRGLLLQVVGDLDPGAGKVGVATSGGLQLEAPRLQPVEPPAFADDFMREPNETGPWEATVGWTTTTVGDTSKSANGFFYRGTGNPGRAVTGFEFWDDYVVHASFKAAQEEGTVGIGLYFQDPKNYLALTWSSLRGMQLVRVRHGSPHVLATKPAAWVPNQWYRLSVQVLDGSLTAMVDGRVCLQATDASFGRGKVALLVDGKEFYFDDVVVKPATYFHDPAPFTHRVRWANVGGVQLAGSTAWQDYTLRVRATPADRSGLGIVFGWRGPRDYYLLRWGAEGASAGRKQILRVNGAKSVVVADAAGGYRPGQTYTIETTFRPGYAAVSINGKRALETADPGLTHGAIGFKPLSRAVREVTVALYEEPTPPEEEITKEFTNSDAHPDMAEWANPAKAWIARQAAMGERVHWRKGDYYGDVSVQIPVPVLNPNARLNAILAASGENPGTGYTFQVRRPAPDKLALQLLRPAATKPVAAAATAVPADKPVSLTLARQGSYLVADLEGKRILKFRDATPLDGSRLGIETTGDGVNLDLRTVQVKSRNVYDYTFHDAPTDWQPQYGVWEVTNRWSCSPGWSWFGGRSERLAVIWNKRRFTGDLVLEYYAAPKMDAVPEAYTERFRDLNATICGDGERLNSGYSFIIGGWHNKKTVILRGDRPVAETETFRLPPQEQGHRQWFHVRIEKRGNRVSLWVNNPVVGAPIPDKPLLSWEDPDPLPGDRIALWTQNNGLMLARVVVGYQQERAAPILARRPGKPQPDVAAALPAAPQPVAVPLFNDFEQSLGLWQSGSARVSLDGGTAAQGKRSLRIENAEPGGEFKAIALAGQIDVSQAPHLSFDYRVPPGVQVNLYVRIKRAYYAIGFTGSGQVNPAAGVLAALEPIKNVRADDAWHHAQYDLLTALRRLIPTGPVVVEEIVLANWDPSDEYVLAGVTGNSLGARYYLDRFALGAAPTATKVVRKTLAPSPAAGARPAKAAPTKAAPTKAAPAKAAPAKAAAAPAKTTSAKVAPAKATPTKAAPAKAAPAKAAPKPKPLVRVASARPGGLNKSGAGARDSRQVAAAPPTGPTVALLDPFIPGREVTRWEAMEGKWVVTKEGFFTPTEKPEFAYAFAGDLNWTDYVLKADLIRGQDAGLCVRAQDWNNCVFLVIRPGHRDLWWFVRRNGEWGGVLAPMALDFGPKELLKVKVSVVGDTYTCYLDGKKVSQIKDGTFTKGRIGVYIHPAEAGQAWDNVEVILPRPTKAIAHN